MTREEEEEAAMRQQENLLGDGSLAGLESAARDAVARVMANPDVQNLGESLRTGALKVCFRLSRCIIFDNHIPDSSRTISRKWASARAVRLRH